MKKTLVILLTALLLAVCLSAAGEEASPVNRIPAEYTTPVKEGGTVERIEYPAHDWPGTAKNI